MGFDKRLFTGCREADGPESKGGGGTAGSDVTLCQNGSVFIRCRTMAVGAALAL